MNKIEKLLDYLFSLRGSLNRKSFFLHYFLDLFLFLILMLFASLSVPLLAPYIENIKILDISLSVIFFATSALLVIALFIMNRLSILLRRLYYLKMNPAFCMFVFLPLIGLMFDLYLLLKHDSEKLTNY